MSYIDTHRPHNGRYICEDDSLFNIADYSRAQQISISRGQMPGAYPLITYGERTATGAETMQPVWPNGPMAVPDISGIQVAVSSTGANDSATGTGIQQVKIHYLDINLEPNTEIVTTNGLTPVPTQATDIRFIQCMNMHRVGSLGSSAGTIEAIDNGTIYSIISQNARRCASSFRMVPGGKRLFIEGAVVGSISGTSAARSQFRLVASQLEDHQYIYPHFFLPQAAVGLQDSAIHVRFPVSAPFFPGTVFGVEHTSDKACTVSATLFARVEPL